MILEGKNISFQYGRHSRLILDDVSLYVKSKERVGISAPSGFGKTTLCKILSGYEKADQGHVTLDGNPLSDYGRYCPVQMIWQHPEQMVNPRLKMKEVLAEGDQVEDRVIQALGIEPDWLNRFPGELSGGELQRFCIARALGQRTRMILADEITTMLDLITQSQIWNFLLEEVKRREIGLLVISHTPALLGHICTRQIELEDGSKV